MRLLYVFIFCWWLIKTGAAEIPVEASLKNASCGSTFFQTVVEVNKPIGGVLFAKGLPYQKSTSANACFVYFENHDRIVLNLRPDKCGVRVKKADEGKLTFYVDLILKYGAENEMIISSSCNIDASDFMILQSSFRSEQNKKPKIHFSEVWMDLEYDKPDFSTATVSITTIAAEIYEVAVTNCYASDGFEFAEQLSDENGCPVKQKALSDFTQKMGYIQEATLNIFEFNASSVFHLQCQLKICQNSCNLIDCDGKIDPVNGTLIETLRVFNSIVIKQEEIESDSSSYRRGWILAITSGIIIIIWIIACAYGAVQPPARPRSQGYLFRMNAVRYRGPHDPRPFPFIE